MTVDSPTTLQPLESGAWRAFGAIPDLEDLFPYLGAITEGTEQPETAALLTLT
jgi:hypothetical protein